jgi:Spy/CpxP family protein refolding chaperone
MRHAHHCGCAGEHERRSHAPWLGHWERHFHPGDPFAGESGVFGVRRPLRFLAWRLQLDEAQLAEIAASLNDLKTERAQAAVDDRRAMTAYADAIESGSFGADKAKEASERRVTSRRTVEDAVVRFLTRAHAVLSPEQRGKLAYLIRTGALAV